MKKMPRYCAGPAYYGMCSTDVYCSKQTGSSSTKGNHHPHHFTVSGIGQKKLSMQPKFVAQENVVKTETQQTFVNGLLGFITLFLFAIRWKRDYYCSQ